MKLRERLSAGWVSLGLRQRLLIMLSAGIASGFLLISGFMIQQAVDRQHQRQAEQLQEFTGVLVPLVAEQVLVGDFVSLEQLLERIVQHRPQIVRLRWDDERGHRLETREKKLLREAPGWFATLSGLHPEILRQPISLNGEDFGALYIHASPATAVDALWQQLMSLLFVMGIMAITGFLILNHLLRTSLRAVDRLAAAATRLRDGNHHETLSEEGSAEVRATVAAFNDMAAQLEKLVSDLSTSQRQMREQLNFVETLFEAFPSPVCVVNRDGVYRGVNHAWEQFFNIRREQIVGTRGEALYTAHPALRTMNEDMDLSTRDNLATRTIEMDLAPAQDDARRLHVARSTYADSEHAVAGTISVITDLTALAEAEQRMQAALVEKTSAEAANLAKSRFMANMSHEIRTPLTAIIGYAESLLDSDQGMEERIAGIRTIIRAGQHLHQIINDILDLSKIEAGRLEVECIPVHPVELCREVAALAQVRADEKGLAFRLEQEFPLPAQICSDPLRLKQALINLTGNAVKFTAHGSVVMNLRCDRAREQLIVEVTDTGIGMTAAQCEQLFMPFTQADATTTRRFGGTGLGLYLARQFAQRLGGDIQVTSTPGQGSTFTLTVATRSLAKTAWIECEIPPVEMREVLSCASVERVQGEVLVVEDNDDNRKLVTLYLRKIGIEPHFAENGAIAVERAARQRYALILMDMQMPVMDGLEATRRLRVAGYNAPIVALTANASKQDEQNCRKAGCDGFVPKPIDRARLLDEVRRHLRSEEIAATANEEPLVSALYEEEPELAGLVEKFVARFPDMIVEMEAAAARADWAALKGQAHNLKGVGGGYGYPQVSKVAAQLEFAAAKADADGVAGLIGELQQLAQRITRGAQSTEPLLKRKGAG